jgi:hypothetical protein
MWPTNLLVTCHVGNRTKSGLSVHHPASTVRLPLYRSTCLLSSGTPQSPGALQRQQFRVVCCLRNPRSRRSTRLCLWESLPSRASIAVQAATVPDIARPDTTPIASRNRGIKMIFLLQPT